MAGYWRFWAMASLKVDVIDTLDLYVLTHDFGDVVDSLVSIPAHCAQCLLFGDSV
jgi:hypothetical protein